MTGVEGAGRVIIEQLDVTAGYRQHAAPGHGFGIVGIRHFGTDDGLALVIVVFPFGVRPVHPGVFDIFNLHGIFGLGLSAPVNVATPVNGCFSADGIHRHADRFQIADRSQVRFVPEAVGAGAAVVVHIDAQVVVSAMANRRHAVAHFRIGAVGPGRTAPELDLGVDDIIHDFGFDLFDVDDVIDRRFNHFRETAGRVVRCADQHRFLGPIGLLAVHVKLGENGGYHHQ